MKPLFFTIRILCFAAMLVVPLFAADSPAAKVEAPTIFEVSQLDEKPAVLKRVRPEVPSRLLREGVKGSAEIEFVLDAKGQMQNARVRSATHKEFGEAALKCVSKWKFSPGKKDGQPVNTLMVVPIRFSR